MPANGRLPAVRPTRVKGLNSEVIDQPFNLIEEGGGRTQKAHVFGAPKRECMGSCIFLMACAGYRRMSAERIMIMKWSCYAPTLVMSTEMVAKKSPSADVACKSRCRLLTRLWCHVILVYPDRDVIVIMK